MTLSALAIAFCALGTGAPVASAVAPVISAEAPTEVGVSTARGHGKVAPGGKETFYRFEYVSDQQFDQNESDGLPGFEGAGAAFGALAADAGEADVEPLFEGLVSGTEYHLRLVAENEDGTEVATAPNFTTDTATAPTLTIDPPSDVSYTQARISGSIDPEGGNQNPASGDAAPIGWELQLSTTAGEGFFGVTGGAIEGSEAESDDPIAVPADPEGFLVEALANNTTYYYRLVAYYAGKEAISSEGSFTTDLVTPPLVEADNATSVTGQTAHFSGEVIAGNADPAFDATCAFDFVPEAQFQIDSFDSARTVPCDPNPVKGTAATAVTAHPSGLLPGTTYRLRLRAENQGGTETDEAATFQTEAIAPRLSNLSASEITGTSATLRATVNPGGASTTYHFEYLTAAAYDAAAGSFSGAASTPEAGPIGPDAESHPVETQITGLQPGTAYRFRLVATNAESGPGGTISGVASVATAGSGDGCANAGVRAQQGSQYLPECRAYEIVNKPSLDQGEVNRVPHISDDGEFVAYVSGVPADEALGAAPYEPSVAHRSPGGWTSRSAGMTSLGPIRNTAETAVLAYSKDFSQALFRIGLPAVPSDTDGSSDLYRVVVGLGTPTLMSQDVDTFPGEVFGGSPDLSRVAFRLGGGSSPGPGLYVSDGDILETVVTGEFVFPAGAAYQRGLGVGDGRVTSPWVAHGGNHGVSDDAHRIYYKTINSPLPHLFLWDATIHPPATTDIGFGRFISASHDGSIAYLESPEQLTPSAPPGGGIYRFDAANGELTLLTPDPGDPAGLQLIGAIASDDMSHIYFTSKAAVAPGAVAGEGNAYLWTEADGVRFLARVNGGGIGPDGLSTGDRFERVSTDGRYALMLSTASIAGAPNNGHKALYEYDYASDQIACASCRPDGSSSQGDALIEAQSPGLPGGPYTQGRSLSDDGRVFFDSTDRLVAADQTTAMDVYVYDKGSTALISSGRIQSDSYYAENSDDGDHVFFYTRSALVGADRDAAELDVYDAHLGGGFLEPPPPPAPCEGEACRGQGSSPALLPGFATQTLKGSGNPKRCAKGKVRRNGRCVKRKPRKHRHHHKGHAGKKHKHADKTGGTGR